MSSDTPKISAVFFQFIPCTVLCIFNRSGYSKLSAVVFNLDLVRVCFGDSFPDKEEGVGI